MTGNAHLKNIAKSTQVGYALSWNKQLNFHLGWHSWYMTGRQYYSAFGKLYEAILHVQSDKKQRVFVIDKKTNEINKTLSREFAELVIQFKGIFGIDASPDGKFTYLNLRALEKPDPKNDKVYISRKVPFEFAWGMYTLPYVVFKAGYAFQVIEYVQTPYGTFPQTKIIPMTRRDDGTSLRQRTNCIPYVSWQEQSHKVLSLLQPIAKDIETIIALHLHLEGEQKYVPSSTEGISMDYDNEAELGDAIDDSGGMEE